MDWYEQWEPGLGERFFRALQQAVRLIQIRPEIHPLRFDGIRRVMLKKFPYSVYFEHDECELRILAVFHQSRNPSDLQRLEKP